jgi:hypothetical protein
VRVHLLPGLVPLEPVARLALLALLPRRCHVSTLPRG